MFVWLHLFYENKGSNSYSEDRFLKLRVFSSRNVWQYNTAEFLQYAGHVVYNHEIGKITRIYMHYKKEYLWSFGSILFMKWKLLFFKQKSIQFYEKF